jgi:TatD DNase family protein
MIDLLSNMPLDRIMIETDSPYLLPKNLKIKGRRNEPKFIVEVAKKIAKLQNKNLDEISQIFFENSMRFFNL